MQDNLKSNLGLFLTEQRQEGLCRFRRENKEYGKLRKTHAQAGERMQTILKSLPEEEMEFAEKFTAEIHTISKIESGWVYLQGYKDCFGLLAYLGILEVRS